MPNDGCETEVTTNVYRHCWMDRNHIRNTCPYVVTGTCGQQTPPAFCNHRARARSIHCSTFVLKGLSISVARARKS
jgi:hypothetical protein